MPEISPPDLTLEHEFWERQFVDRAPGARGTGEPHEMPPRPAFALREHDRPFARVVERFHEWRDDTRFGVVVLVVVAVVAGVVWYRIGMSGGDDAAAAPSAVSAPTTATTTAPAAAKAAAATATTPSGGVGAKIVVHVAGAVAHAGVVELAGNARIIDAIKAAGGAQADGDLDRLNLAAKLADGERVYVAKVGQADPGVLGSASAGASSGAASGATATINLNTATQAQLETLPGIGPTYAHAIIAQRQASGGFKSVNELRNVRGIGDTRFAELAPLVTV